MINNKVYLKIKIKREDDNTISVSAKGNKSELKKGLSALVISLVTDANFDGSDIIDAIISAIKEAEHEPTEHD